MIDINMNKDKQKLMRVLSIDGGGIRGILPGKILVALEKKLQKRTGRPDARIADYFDLIAGTSTGGILTCLYLTPDKNGRPKYSAQDAVDLYLKHGTQIFSIPFLHSLKSIFGITDEKYPVDVLEKLMEEKVGDVRLSQLVDGCHCIITAFNVKEGDTIFFTSSDAGEKEGKDFLLRNVARATSAAPTYFQAAGIKSVDGKKDLGLIDGGVFANNPTMCALAEAFKMQFGESGRFPRVEDVFILSIGTKNSRPKFDFRKVKQFGQLQWIVPIIDIMMSGVSETVAFQVKQLYQLVEALYPEKKNQYIRLDPHMGDKTNSAMDDASPKNLALLAEAGDRAAEEFDEKLDIAVEKLLQGREDGIFA